MEEGIISHLARAQDARNTGHEARIADWGDITRGATAGVYLTLLRTSEQETDQIR